MLRVVAMTVGHKNLAYNVAVMLSLGAVMAVFYRPLMISIVGHVPHRRTGSVRPMLPRIVASVPLAVWMTYVSFSGQADFASPADSPWRYVAIGVLEGLIAGAVFVFVMVRYGSKVMAPIRARRASQVLPPGEDVRGGQEQGHE